MRSGSTDHQWLPEKCAEFFQRLLWCFFRHEVVTSTNHLSVRRAERRRNATRIYGVRFYQPREESSTGAISSPNRGQSSDKDVDIDVLATSRRARPSLAFRVAAITATLALAGFDGPGHRNSPSSWPERVSTGVSVFDYLASDPTEFGATVITIRRPGTVAMSTSSGQKKLAARCENCQSIFASEMGKDGTIRPIGTKQGCRCGSEDFRPLGFPAPSAQ